MTASNLSAQDTDTSAKPEPKSRWELRVPSGTLVPTGAQRDAIKRGNLTAVQLTYVARPALAITSTVGWARSRDVATADNPKLDVFTYDVGAEVRAPRSITGRGGHVHSVRGSRRGRTELQLSQARRRRDAQSRGVRQRRR